MEQITEDYVSFETAKLLKEKGFENNNGMLLGKSGRHYNKYETFPSKDMAIEASIDCEDKCPLVTLQMAMKWLRKVHNLHIAVIVAYNHLPRRYEAHIMKLEDIDDFILHQRVDFASYEEACEAAIKYCLENLI